VGHAWLRVLYAPKVALAVPSALSENTQKVTPAELHASAVPQAL
jgi:hypothetical protein